MKKNLQIDYYLGFDVGANVVGYAATDTAYNLLKYKGKLEWGVHTFEPAELQEKRRRSRLERRRLNRRQTRVALLSELFAPEIAKLDESFFIRRKESALLGIDTQFGVSLLNNIGMTDKEYYAAYPTIHHLIVELMENGEAHDVRLVYLACAWLLANRGHFLYSIPAENVEQLSDFNMVYDDFKTYLSDNEYSLPWDESITAQDILSIMRMKAGITEKKNTFIDKVYGGRKEAKDAKEGFPFSREIVGALLCGGDSKPAKLFVSEELEEVPSVSLKMDDETFVSIVSEIGDEGELLIKLRAMYDCMQLIETLKEEKTISKAKVATYNIHKEDLKFLKYFIRKYRNDKYDEVFKKAGTNNYTAYSYNLTSLNEIPKNMKKASKDEFCEYLEKIVKGIEVETEDAKKYEDMLTRLELRTFLPKQKETENRVIPQQLYRYELDRILENASGYLSFLNGKDENGLTVKSKILSIFDFKIPYFVGPLNPTSEFSWIGGCRKSEHIYPWNFENMVDYDKCEEAFIRRMTGKCTYLPGEDVLPSKSLLYEKFTVLNEINNLKINGEKLHVAVKQDIYNDLFLNGKRVKVTPKQIAGYLKSTGSMQPSDELGGLDEKIKSSLKMHHAFSRMLSSGALTEQDVEAIIKHASYITDANRLGNWIKKNYPQLPEEDRKYIQKLDMKGFGRMSEKFLNGIIGTDVNTGEAFTIMEAMWNTNDNLMQLLSRRYTFRTICEEYSTDYYIATNMTLDDRLSEMYVSNTIKRPVFRTLAIADDVVKAEGCVPKKVFINVENSISRENKRPVSRKERILELYKNIKNEDAKILSKELKENPNVDNELQDDRVYLYYLQLGKCIYTGQPIDLKRLNSAAYCINHIFPRRLIKDNSLNNRVLVLSNAMGIKDDEYPIPESIREDMQPFWEYLLKSDLISKEKYFRLIRTSGISSNEKKDFISQQFSETGVCAKALGRMLKLKYPETEIIYVKSENVSDFRKEYDLIRCREANRLFHAKDAFLNIVVGNVYHERFSNLWFNPVEEYDIQTKKMFESQRKHGNEIYWNGYKDVIRVGKTLEKNAIQMTRYAVIRKSGQNGGMFNQLPKKKGEGSIPRKSNLDPNLYGGYSSATASFFCLTKCYFNGEQELRVVPIDLMNVSIFDGNEDGAINCIADSIYNVTGKYPDKVELPIGLKKIKINTVFSFDGMEMNLVSKTGDRLGFVPLSPIKFSRETEKYIKNLTVFAEKLTREEKRKKYNKTEEKSSPRVEIPEEISRQKNMELYDLFISKLSSWPFMNMPNKVKLLTSRKDLFKILETEKQVCVLLNILTQINTGKGTDLTDIGGSKLAGTVILSGSVTKWAEKYSDVHIIDYSASGLFSSASENILNYA